MADSELTTVLRRHRVMAIIRGTSEEAALETGRVLLEEGIRLVEITLTTPGALSTVTALREGAPDDALVGAGTVLTEADVTAVADAGGQFIVTPGVTPGATPAPGAAARCAAADGTGHRRS